MPLQSLSSYRNRTPGALPMAPAGFDGWDTDPNFSFDHDQPVSSPWTDPDQTSPNESPDANSGFGNDIEPPKPTGKENAALKDLPMAPDAGGLAKASPPKPPDATENGANDGGLMPPPPPPPATAADTPNAPDTPENGPDSGGLMPPPIAPRTSSASQQLQAMEPPPPPKPRWYNKLAAAAAGGLGGYMAARYPGRVNPGTVQAAEQNLMAPGYGRQRAAFEQQRADLEEKQKTQLTQEQIEGQRDQREATAEWRRAQAKKASEDNATKEELAREKQSQADLASRRTAFGKLVGKHTPVYVDPKDPVPPGFTVLQDPDVAGKVALVPAGLRQSPKELVDGGMLPGYKAGDTIDSDTLAKAYDAFWKQQAQSNKPAPLNNIAELYRDANDATSPTQKQSTAALKQYRTDQIQQALSSRPAREPSAAQVEQQRKTTVRSLANRALKESSANGGKSIDDAIRNVQQFYEADPDMEDNRGDVIAQLNQWKRQGLSNEQMQARVDQANGRGRLQLLGGVGGSGGRGAPPPPPRSNGGASAPPPPATSAPPKEVIARLGPGDHKFQNGQTWRIKADGTATRIQ